MTKSVPTGTQQSTNYNPTGDAQRFFLNDVWEGGRYLAGVGPDEPVGTAEYLDPLRGYAQNQFAGTQPFAQATMPWALSYANQALSGTLPQANLPGGQQIGQLGGMANAAAQAGLNYAQPLAASGVAAQTVGGGYGDLLRGLSPGAQQAGAGWGNALGDIGSAAANAGQGYAGNLSGYAPGAYQTGAGYGNALTQAGQGATNIGLGYGQTLADRATAAQDVGTGYGSQIANAAYGAPGTVAPSVAGLQGLAGQYANLPAVGGNQWDTLTRLGQGALGAGQGVQGQFGALSGAAQNIANPATGGLYGAAGMGISGNPIYDSLRGMASGQYIDPSRNPALAGTIQAATDPLVRQYMTATAPQTDSSFEAAGRYGSGAHVGQAGAVAQNQQNLATGLGAATSNIVNNAYNTGLQSTLGAGQALGSAYNTGVGNISNALAQAGQLGQAGVNNAGQLLGAGNTALQNAYQNAGNITGAAGTQYGNLANIGLGGMANAYTGAGQLGLSGLQQMLSGLGTGGQLANQGYQTGGQILSNAAQAANTGAATGIGALGQGATAANQGYQTLANMLGTAGQLGNQGYQTAANAYGQAGNVAGQGWQNAGNMLSQAAQAANQGYGTGGQLMANAGQLANQGYATGITGLSQAGNLANTGTLNLGGIAQMAPELANFPLSQLQAGYNTNWTPAQNFAGLLGVAPQGGSSNTSGTQQQNVASNILSGLGGIASLAKAI